MVRMSELCGQGKEEACNLDFLANHDSASMFGQQYFATAMASMPDDSPFNVDWNTSVIAKHCVHRAASLPYASYMSCDGPTTEEYVCVCGDMFDRCVARQPCGDVRPPRAGCDVCPPECSLGCSEKDIEYGLRVVGRTPAYLPELAPPNVPGMLPNGSLPWDWKCPWKLEQSEFVGHWYSTPAAAQCPTGTRHFSQSTAECTWARDAEQSFIRGIELSRRGYNASRPMALAQLRQNEQLMQAAFEEASSRCCGC